MRLRQEAVRAAEASLTDRAASAELACREAERRRRVAEAAVAASDEQAHKAEGEVTKQFPSVLPCFDAMRVGSGGGGPA